jgi:hypothetical protein
VLLPRFQVDRERLSLPPTTPSLAASVHRAVVGLTKGIYFHPLIMPWRCPACGLTVQHSEDIPRIDVIYRCHICRLDLVTDHQTGKMRLAPVPGSREKPAPKKKSPKGPDSAA